MSKIRNVKRVDIVFDVYKEKGIKSSTREKRDFGRRIKVNSTTRIPKTWHNFLRVNENKTELFGIISNYIISIDCQQHIVATLMTKLLQMLPL